MAKVVKTVRIEETLLEKLGAVADLEFGGNATAALEAFIEQASALRSFTEKERWAIYSVAKSVVVNRAGVQCDPAEELKRTRSLTAALWI
jgi:hypothetical protein